MKKLFTFFTVAAMSLAAMATDYTGTLVVNVDGEIISSNTTISVVDNGSNSYTLSIRNFVLDDLPIGNIVLTTNGIAQDKATILKVNENITIEEGDDASVEGWAGPILGEVPINMTAIFKDGAMYTNIDIYMALLEQVINVSFTSDNGFVTKLTDGYQIPNGNFEAWAASSGEPDHWHGFKSCKGGMSSLVTIAGMSLAKSTDKHSGTYSALLTSGSALGTVANGTMTTGQLNAGSRTASDVSNHSEMDKTSTATDKNGDLYYTSLVGYPDALNTWIKFSQKSANSDHPYATVSAILFDGTYYQDPEDKTYTNITAKAKNNTIPTGGWTEYTIPFTGYTSVEPEALLITVSTNADAGQGSKGDQVWVDDMELLYYGEVTGITINGIDNLTFNAATHSYNVEAAGEFTEDDVTVTKTGAYSYLLKSVNAIEGGYVITVTVIPNDMSKAEVYTINVIAPQPDVYIMGDVNGNGWATNVGVPMTYDADNDEYTATVTVNDTYEYGYFSFTTALAETADDWDGIAASRFGAVAEGDNFLVTTENQGNISLTAGGKALQIRPGEYVLTMSGDRSSLSIAGDIIDPFYLAGTFTNWATDKLAMDYNAEDGSYSITVEGIESGAQFKFIDASNNWYGGDSNGDTYVVHPKWCEDIQLSTTGKNFEVNGSGDLTFTVDADKKLTITGWDVQGVTLAEALAGEEGDVLITSDMKVVVANSNYAIVSDGLGNWLKVTGQELTEGDVIANVTGTISGLDLNPVMAATDYQASEAIVDVEPTGLNLGTIHREALTALKSNEVAYFVGYYNAETGELCAFSSGSGLHIAMTTDNMTGSIVNGKQQTITGVVSLKEAWDAPSGAPARVAIDDDQAFENIQIDATAASVPTGVETVKSIDGKEVQGIYNVNGQQVKSVDKGVYIIRYSDGTAAKVRF